MSWLILPRSGGHPVKAVHWDEVSHGKADNPDDEAPSP